MARTKDRSMNRTHSRRASVRWTGRLALMGCALLVGILAVASRPACAGPIQPTPDRILGRPIWSTGRAHAWGNGTRQHCQRVLGRKERSRLHRHERHLLDMGLL